MAIVKTDDKHYKNIASAIREQTGKTAAYKPEQIPAGIAEVGEAGYTKGYSEGYKEGYARGHVDGYVVGEETERVHFWDVYQNYGYRTDYRCAFAGAGWTDKLFQPEYDIVVESGYQMFAYCAFSGSLKKRLAACGVAMIFRGNATLQNLFGYAEGITELGVMDFSQVTATNNTHVFNNCISLQTIEKLIPPTGQSTWKYWFNSCTALQNVIFEGTISSSGLDLSGSPLLSHDSLISILNCLADKSSSSSSWTVTLGATNLGKLTDSEQAIATQKGWVLA